MLLTPNADTILTMARKVLEASEIRHLGTFSFSLSPHNQKVYVALHDDEEGTSTPYEVVTLEQLIISYIGLSLPLDLDANDAVTTGHRLNNTGR